MNSLLDPNSDDHITIDENKNYLEELVGEGKKFRSVEELAKGKYMADLHAQTLERKADQLREDYLKLREEHNARAKIEELLDQMQRKQQSSSDNTQNANDEQNRRPETDYAELEKKFESLIPQKIKEYEERNKADYNFSTVKSKLIEHFGPNYGQVYKEHVNSLGLSVEDMDALARKSPVAFFKTLGINDAPRSDSFQAPPRTRQSSSFTPNTPKRTWSYYQKMRQEKPDLFYDKKITAQMEKDYLELGPAFEDGDFNS
jgi:hypothetical protein